MNGIELEALRFQHACARMNARRCSCRWRDVRRVEQHQATLVNWLLGAGPFAARDDHRATSRWRSRSPPRVALHEPDPYLAQVYRFGLLEDFDHLYRYSALLDRLEGKDANNILQSYTDILPGRPDDRSSTARPQDDLRTPYDRATAAPLTKLQRADASWRPSSRRTTTT